MDKILVVGGGSWGTAFANFLAPGHPVKLWLREPDIVEAINDRHENPVFLSDIPLSPRLEAVSNLEEETKNADIIIFAVPSKFIRQTFSRLKTILGGKTIVNLSKGIESTSLKTISRIAADVLGPDILDSWVTISGPSFARELASKHPTAVVAASTSDQLSETIQEEFSGEHLRIYRSNDLTGIEMGGSLKNVMAIAAGIVNGLGFGTNTTATLVTRASVEISRFGITMGARGETFWGLAGIGDLMLTCFGTLSRNFQLGKRIARGETLEKIEKSSKMIAEGVETTKAVHDLAEKMKIDMPITNQVYKILFEKKSPETALQELMKRSLKTEWTIN